MTSVEELRSRVAASYELLDVPSWPSPRPMLTPPREEEYSRVSRPERYGIVHVRARVWADVLGDLPGVEVETLASAPLDDEGLLGRFDRGVRLTSPLPGTLPLFLLEHDAQSLAVLLIRVARPQILLQTVPDCGCDACDLGSDDLLHVIDQTISYVVGGPFVALRGTGWSAQWHPDGGSSGGTGRRRRSDHAKALELCRQLAAGEDVVLPEGTDAFVGHSWLS
ncbi:DUF6226 family protein [Actinopolymorpha pittospori]